MKSTTSNTNTRFAAHNATTRRSSTSQAASRGSHRGTPSASSNVTTSASPCMESLASLRVPTTATIPLIDPTGRGGLIHVPVTKTMDTKGRTEYFQGILRKEVSLCCLFQKGRCHAGEKCHQIHVDTGFIQSVRAQNAHIISCCRACKDTASLSGNAVTFFATHFDKPTVKIVAPDGCFSLVDSNKLAITTGLTQHVEQLSACAGDVTSIPTKKLCRLHLRGACKYAKDCKNIHLCSDLGEAILAPTTKTATMPEELCNSRSTVASHAAMPIPVCSPPEGIMDRATATPHDVTAPKQQRRPSTCSTISSHSDAPKDYFSESRFQTPPPSLLSRRSSLESESPEPVSPDVDPLEETICKGSGTHPLSFSQVDISNISFMERSCPAMPGLSFDPTIALELDLNTAATDVSAPKQQAQTSLSSLNADWFDDCGCSTSNTPSKLQGLW